MCPNLYDFFALSRDKQIDLNGRRQDCVEFFLCFKEGRMVFVVGDSGTGKTTYVTTLLLEGKYPWMEGPEVVTIVSPFLTYNHQKIVDHFQVQNPTCKINVLTSLTRDILSKYGQKRHIVLIDDMDFQGKRAIETMTYLCNISASKHNVNGFIIVHNPFQDGMKAIRDNSTTYIIFPNKNRHQISNLLCQYIDNKDAIEHIKDHLYNPNNGREGWLNLVLMVFDTAANAHFFNNNGEKINIGE